MKVIFQQQAAARRVLKAIWVAAMIFVVWSSLLPGDSSLKKAVDDLDLSDFALHFGAYLVLSLLAALAQQTKRKSVIAALLMGVLGLALEVLQGFTPTRSMDAMDAAANWAGVACGMLLGLVLA